jgi:hypothetical protein
VWVGTARRDFGYATTSGRWISAGAGAIVLGQENSVRPGGLDAGWLSGGGGIPLCWWFSYEASGSYWCVRFPLWMLLTPAGVASGAAWRLDTLARRRSRPGLCPVCGYNRAGLAPTSPCPECDAPPPAAAVAGAKD